MSTISRGVATANVPGLVPNYERGTFAPALAKASGAGTLGAVTLAHARYVKIGNLVHIEVYYSAISITVGTVVLTMTLPFGVKNTDSAGFIYSSDNTTRNVGRVAMTGGGSTAASPTPSAAGNTSWAISAAASFFIANFSYETDS